MPNVNVGFGAIVSAGATIKKDVKELGIYNRDLEIIKDRVFDSKLYYKE